MDSGNSNSPPPKQQQLSDRPAGSAGSTGPRARSPAQAATRLLKIQDKEVERRATVEAKWLAGLDPFHIALAHLNHTERLLQLKRAEVAGRKKIKSFELLALFTLFEAERRSEIQVDEYAVYFVGGPEGSLSRPTSAALNSTGSSRGRQEGGGPQPPPLTQLKVQEVGIRMQLLEERESRARCDFWEDAGDFETDLEQREQEGEEEEEGCGEETTKEQATQAQVLLFSSAPWKSWKASESHERQQIEFKEARRALEEEQSGEFDTQVQLLEAQDWEDNIFSQRKKAFQSAVDAAFHRLLEDMLVDQQEDLQTNVAAAEAQSWIHDHVQEALLERHSLHGHFLLQETHDDVYPTFISQGTEATLATEARAREVILQEESTLRSTKAAIHDEELQDLKQKAAAPIIQRRARQHLAQSNLSCLVVDEVERRRDVAATLCQRLLRAHSSDILVQERFHQEAVKLMNRVVDGYHFRVQCSKQFWQRRLQAAQLIERVGRAWLARETVAEVWTERSIEAAEVFKVQTEAIQRIQWVGRSYLAAQRSHTWKTEQRRLREKKVGTLIFQRHLNVRLANTGVEKRRHEERLRKIIKVQSLFRAYGADGGRKEMTFLFKLKWVQAQVRYKVAMVALFLKQRNTPARRIQKAVRRMLAVRKVGRARTARKQGLAVRKQVNAVIRIQAASRDWLFRQSARIARNNSQKERYSYLEGQVDDHVEKWQSYCRGFVQGRMVVARLYQQKVQRITLVQSHLRFLGSHQATHQERGITLHNQLVQQLLDQNAKRITHYVGTILDTTLQNIALRDRQAAEDRLAELHDVIERFIRKRQSVEYVRRRKFKIEIAACDIQESWGLFTKRRDAKVLLAQKRQAYKEKVELEACTKIQKNWVHRMYKRTMALVLVQRTFLRLRPKIRQTSEQRVATKKLHQLRRSEVTRHWTSGATEIRRQESEARAKLVKAEQPPKDPRHLISLTMTSPSLLWAPHEEARRGIEGSMIRGLLKIKDLKKESFAVALSRTRRRVNAEAIQSLERTEVIERHRLECRELVQRRAFRGWLQEQLDLDFFVVGMATIQDPETEARETLMLDFDAACEDLFDVAEQLMVMRLEKEQHRKVVLAHSMQGGTRASLCDSYVDSNEVESDGEEEGYHQLAPTDEDGLPLTGANLVETTQEQQGLAELPSGPEVLSSLVPRMVVEHLRGFAVVKNRGVNHIPQDDLDFILWGGTGRVKEQKEEEEKKVVGVDPTANVALVTVDRTDAGGVTICPLFPVHERNSPGVTVPSPLDRIAPRSEEGGEEEASEEEGEEDDEAEVEESSDPQRVVNETTTGVRDNSLPQIFQALRSMGVITSLAFPKGSELTSAGLVSLIDFIVQMDLALSVLDLSGCRLLDDVAALHCVRALKTIPTLRDVNLTGAGRVSLRKRQLLRQSIAIKEEQRLQLLRRGSVRSNRLMVGTDKLVGVNSQKPPPTAQQQAAASLGVAVDPRSRREEEEQAAALLVPKSKAEYRQRPLLFPRRHHPVVK